MAPRRSFQELIAKARERLAGYSGPAEPSAAEIGHSKSFGSAADLAQRRALQSAIEEDREAAG